MKRTAAKEARRTATAYAVAAYAALATWGLLKLIDLTIGLRVSPEEEQRGLDTTQHGEVAYQL